MAATDTGNATQKEAGQARAARASLPQLFLSFFRLGSISFGGPAMVPYIRDLVVRDKRWIEPGVFQDGVALCQAIPGATAMQTAAYAGFRARGLPGALASFLGFGLPAFLLMLALSAAFAATHRLPGVVAVFRGLQAVVVALTANAAVLFGFGSIHAWRDGLIAAAAAVFLVANGDPMLAIGGAALAGLVLYRWENRPCSPEKPPKRQATMIALRPALLTATIVILGFSTLYLVNRNLFALAALMARIDLFAFGGGFASVPLMQHEVVETRRWMDGTTFMSGIALGQVTPGPIVITATFVGYQVGGLAGATIATLAVFSPSFLLLLATVPFLDRLRRAPTVQRALRAILASFVGLLLAVTVRFSLVTAWTPVTILTALGCFIALRLKVNVLWVVAAGGLISFVLA
jgi:chromate transporter